MVRVTRYRLVFPVDFQQAFNTTRGERRVEQALVAIRVLLRRRRNFQHRHRQRQAAHFITAMDGSVPPGVTLPRMDRVSGERSPGRRRRGGRFLHAPRTKECNNQLRRANGRLLRIFRVRHPPTIHPHAYVCKARRVQRMQHAVGVSNPVMGNARHTGMHERHVPAAPTNAGTALGVFRPLQDCFPGLRTFQFLGGGGHVRAASVRVDDPWVSALLRVNDRLFRGQDGAFLLRRRVVWLVVFAVPALCFDGAGGSVCGGLRAWVCGGGGWGFRIVCRVCFRVFIQFLERGPWLEGGWVMGL